MNRRFVFGLVLLVIGMIIYTGIGIVAKVVAPSWYSPDNPQGLQFMQLTLIAIDAGLSFPIIFYGVWLMVKWTGRQESH